MECHDCKRALGSKAAYFSPTLLDKWIRCLPCHERAKEKKAAG